MSFKVGPAKVRRVEGCERRGSSFNSITCSERYERELRLRQDSKESTQDI